MAFPDTVTITINATPRILNRIKDEGYSSEYFLRIAAGDELRLFIRNTSYVDKASKQTVDRHSVELTQTILPVAPATVPIVRKSYAVLENQRIDGTVEPVKHTLGVLAFLTEANITKLINYES